MPSLIDIANAEHQDDASAKRVLLVDAAGNIIATLPVSVSSIPLPSNAAQETGGNLAAIKAKTDNLDLATTALRDALLTGIILAAGTNAIGKLAANSGVDIGDVDVLTIPKVKPNALKVNNRTKHDVDASAVLVFDCSSLTSAVVVTVCNAGSEAIYLDFNSSVTSTQFLKKLASGETWEFPIAGIASVITNDLYAIRASAQTDDDVVVVAWEEA